MKWTALTLVLIGLVAGDSVLEQNQEYRYKFKTKTLTTLPELNSQGVDIAIKTRLSSESSDSSSSSSESAESVDKNANKNNECRPLHQTLYARVADQICFSTRQLPICSMGCKVEGKQPRQVDAYCLHKRDTAAQLYLRNIRQGQNPRMDRYPTRNKVTFNLPVKCVSVEDELGLNKDMYRNWLDELDTTFAELAGY